jgi:heat shock protein HtpX
MKFAKRIVLFSLVNLLVVLTISLILGLLGVGRYFSQGGLVFLAIICLLYGFAGSFISLAMSRMLAKWIQGVRVIPENTPDPALRSLVRTVYELARKAGLTVMPEVGIYDSAELNAFATGPSSSRSLVAVSTGLLNAMSDEELRAILGHEITHITNGDMVTMTLLQGLINAFVLFLATILASIASQAMRSRDDRDNGRGGNWFVEYMLRQLFQVVFSLLGLLVVCWYSRRREFEADAGGARLAGRDNMIDALKELEAMHNPDIAAAAAQEAPAFQALKIFGFRSGGNPLATHPPIEERIARLRQLKA